MKKYYLILIVSVLFMACDDIPNSKLVGKWQLKTVESNGIVTPVDTVWYNFQSESIFAAQVYISQRDTVWSFIGMKTQEDDVLSITLIQNIGFELDYLDWNNLNRTFTINEVNRKNLVLISEEGYKYSFIKF